MAKQDFIPIRGQIVYRPFLVSVTGFHSAVLAPLFYSYFAAATIRSLLLLFIQLVLQPLYILLDLSYIFLAPVHPYINYILAPGLFYISYYYCLGVEALVHHIRSFIRSAILKVAWFFHRTCSSILPDHIHISLTDINIHTFLGGLTHEDLIEFEWNSEPWWYHKVLFIIFIALGLYPVQFLPRTKTV